MKRLWSLLTALWAGGIGILMHQWLLNSADEQGLLPRAHPVWIGMLILGALTLVLLGLLGIRPGKPIVSPFPWEAVGAFCAAIGILVGEILLPVLQKESPLLLALALAAVGAFAFLMLGVSRLRGGRCCLVYPALIALYAMLSPLGQYQVWSLSTQPHAYLFPVLAALALMVFCYAWALSGEQMIKPRWLPFLNWAALFLNLLCLRGDRWPLYAGILLWLTGTNFYKIPRMSLPKEVEKCLQMLNGAGFEAYCVGGCVRDALTGEAPHDYDLCTNATPVQICSVFQGYELIHNGEKHGTIGVVMRRQVYEITTFRTEGEYSDSRHPDWVAFVPTVEADLARRDFTVNAMAYHPKTGYVDPFGGQTDLMDGVIRCVGDPEQRFREDPLRILRGTRFAARLGFAVDPATRKAMLSLTPLLDTVARERVLEELNKFLPHATENDLRLFAPVLFQVIPELAPTVDFDQCNPHHAYDVFTHTARVTEAAAPELPLRWAALLHDIGKPQTFTRDDQGLGHFHGHAARSAQMAEEVLRRLKAPNALLAQVVFLIAHHMSPMEPDKKLLRRRVSRYGEENTRYLLALQKADHSGKGTGKKGQEARFEKMERMLDRLLQEKTCLGLSDLAVSGDDLIADGMEPGPGMGQCLQHLLSLVLEDAVPNEKEALLEKARAFRNGRNTP